jgi:hypothetical protein
MSVESQTQPTGRFYTFQTIEGQQPTVREVSVTQTVTKDVAPNIRKSVPAAPIPSKKLSATLERELATGSNTSAAARTVEVIATFVDDIKIPRFPTPRMTEPRTSTFNKSVRARAEQMAGELIAARAPRYRGLAIDLERNHQAKSKGQYWLIKGMVLDVPVSSIRALSERPDVKYVLEAKTDAPPPSARISVGRSLMATDPYAGYSSFFWVGQLDTGVYDGHQLLAGRYDYLRDCVTGDAQCLGGDPSDLCSHGTHVGSVIGGNTSQGDQDRGVQTTAMMDSWKVYTYSNVNHPCVFDRNAGVKAFEQAVQSSDMVIAAEIQDPGTNELGPVAEAADRAYEAGAVVIAAAGNYGLDANGLPVTSSVAAPGSAHKVLAIGAVDAATSVYVGETGRGPTVTDYRYKPDLLAPSNLWSAGYSSSTWMSNFGQTSCATASATGAAVVVRNYFGSIFDPGQIYAYLIMSGNNRYMNNDQGAGLIQLPPPGNGGGGALDITHQSRIDTNISIAAGSRLEVAIWWPESTTTHNDIDLYLKDSTGNWVDQSTTVSSVFEKVTVAPAPAGQYTLRVYGYNVTGTQKVYLAWAVRP